jgi:hypothetical protein
MGDGVHHSREAPYDPGMTLTVENLRDLAHAQGEALRLFGSRVLGGGNLPVD